MWTTSATLIWAQPWWLLATVAVMGPLFAHWWANRPGQPTVFPAVELLVHTQRRPRRWRDLIDLILLVSRCTAVVLIALAFAQPQWQATAQAVTAASTEQRTVAIVLDASGSMQQRGRGGSAFSIAKQRAAALVRSLAPNHDRAMVIVAGPDIRAIWPEPSNRLDALASAIDAIQVSDAYVDLAAAVRTARSLGGEGEVYVFTDGQATAWSKPPGPDVRVETVVDADAPTANAAIDAVRTEPNAAIVGRPTILVVTVRNPGSATIETSISVDGLASAEPMPLSIPAGAARDARFTFVARLAEPLALTVSLTSSADVQPADDTVTWTIGPQAAIPVTVPATQPNLTDAIAPSPRSPFAISNDKPAIYIADASNVADLTGAISRGAGVLVVGRPSGDEPWLPVTADGTPISNPRFNPASLTPGALPAFADASLTGLADVPIARAYRVEPAAGATVLMRYTDGAPAVVERPYGQGHVIALTCDIDDAMAESPLLLPFVHELLHRLVATDATVSRPDLDPRESELARLSPVDHAEGAAPTPLAAARVTAPPPPRPLWPWLMVGVGGLLVVECLIAMFASRQRDSEVAA